MIRHFLERRRAESDLFVRGYKPFRPGVWVKNGFKATIHPVPGTMTVRVFYTELKS